MRTDICRDAVRLACLVADHPVCGRPESHALAALLLLQGARLPARADSHGDPVLLDEQDRSQWERGWVEAGFLALRESMKAPLLTAYHVEAGIAACHASARTWEETDWDEILRQYGVLLELSGSPVHRLNQAVARAMTGSLDEALAELKVMEEDSLLAGYYLLPAIRGELSHRAGDRALARSCFERAAGMAKAAPTLRFLRRRLKELGSARVQ